VVTGTDIRRTTVVIPAAAAWAIGQQLVEQGGSKQGFLGVGSMTVRLRGAQAAVRRQEYGLLVSSVVEGGPADQAGVLVGEIIVALNGKEVQEPEALLALLRADQGGRPATLAIIRGTELRELAVTIGERPVRGAKAGGP
jgi:S1-C subfamily serine protease